MPVVCIMCVVVYVLFPLPYIIPWPQCFCDLDLCWSWVLSLLPNHTSGIWYHLCYFLPMLVGHHSLSSHYNCLDDLSTIRIKLQLNWLFIIGITAIFHCWKISRLLPNCLSSSTIFITCAAVLAVAVLLSQAWIWLAYVHVDSSTCLRALLNCMLYVSAAALSTALALSCNLALLKQ